MTAMTEVEAGLKLKCSARGSYLGGRPCWRELAGTGKGLERWQRRGELVNEIPLAADNAAMLVQVLGLGR